MSTGPTAETTASSSTPASTAESTTITTQAPTTSAETSPSTAQSTTAASSSSSTPTSTSTAESTTTTISTPAPTTESTTIATTQGITTSETSTASSSTATSASSSTPATTSTSGATTTESSTPASTSISTSTHITTSATSATTTASAQSTTAAVSSTSATMSTSPTAETTTSSSTPASTAESTTITTTQAPTTSAETSTLTAQSTTAASSSASTPTSTSTAESTTTTISTPAPTTESTTITTTQGITTSATETSTASSSTAISASSSTPATTSTSGATTAGSSTPASTSISTSTLATTSATSATTTASAQSTTAAVSSTSTTMSTSPTAETTASSSTPASTAESTTITTTQAPTTSAETSTSTAQSTTAASSSASTPTSTSTAESTTTTISTPAPTTESTTITTQAPTTSATETSTASSSTAISASSSTPATTSTSGATTTESSTPASTSISTSTLITTSATSPTMTASAQTTTAASSSAPTPTSTATGSTTTGSSTPAPTTESTTIATTQGITSAETSTASSSTAISASSSTPATTSTSGATTTESSTPASTSISTSTLATTSALPSTTTASAQSTTAAVSSTSTTMSTSPTAETTTSSSTPASTAESTTTTSTQAPTTNAETSTSTAQSTTAASSSASTPTSTSTAESTSTTISTPAPTTESMTITTQSITSETLTTSSSTAISASSSTPATTSTSGATTTESSTPAATSISTSTLATSATSATVTPSAQSTTAAVSSTPTTMSTSPTAETTTSSSTPASTAESTTITTTQASMTTTSTATATAQTTTAASSSTPTPTSTATKSTTTGSSTPASTAESTTIATTQGITSAEASTASSSTAISASSSTPATTSTSGATTTESSTPAATSISTSTLATTSATSETLTASAQSTTAAVSSTPTTMSTSPTAETTTSSSTPASTTESPTITTQATATSETSTATAKTSTAASSSAATPTSTVISESTTTGSSSPTSTAELTTVTTTQGITTSEVLNATSSIVIPAVSLTPASTGTTTASSTPASTSISTLPFTVTTAASETSTASAQSTTAAMSARSTTMSTSPTAETTASSSTPASTAESTTITTQATAISAEIPITIIQTNTTASSSTAPSAAKSTTTPNSTSASITESTGITTSGTSETVTASAQTITAAMSSSSPSPIAQTSANSFTPTVTTEPTTITTATIITIEPPIVPVTNNPGQETQKTKFNVTFTVLTLPFNSSLQNQTSPSYMDISSNILDELNQLYANSKVNSTFVKCHSVTFRPANDGNSTDEAFCDFMKSASAQQVDKVLLYHEFQNNTNGITTLGSYSLDSNSLFVDGYHESVVLTTTSETVTASVQTITAAVSSASIPTSSSPIAQTSSSSSTPAATTVSTTITTAPAITIEPPIVPVTNNPGQETQKTKFNVTFTVLTLPFNSSLQNQTSPSYMDISSNILDELNQLYANSKVNSTFVKCHSVTFRPANDGNSTDEAFCDFMKSASAQQVDKVLLYHEFQNNTNGITTLGSYSLDSNSLFVDGYHESVVLTTTSETVTASVQTITAAVSSASIPTSSSPIAQTSSSSSTPAATTVSTTITTAPAITIEPPIVPVTNNPGQETQKTKFNVTFTVLTLRFTSSLQNQTSPSYMDISSNILDELNQLYANSKVNSTFVKCHSVYFRSANDGNSTVEAFCDFIKNASAQQVDKVLLYHEFQNNTNGITTLGSYSLDSNSLFVDGYHESVVLTTTSETVTASAQTVTAAVSSASTPTSSSPITQTSASSSTPAVTTESTTITTAPAITIETPIVPVTNNPGQETQKTKFNVTFTVLTLPFNSSLQNQTSPSYMDISSNILDELNQLYANSKVNSTFVKCHSVSFRSANDGNSTVEAFCDFIKNASAQQVDKVLLYHEFQNNTNGITTLGSYSLDSNSLFVDGYHESVVLTTTSETVTASAQTVTAAVSSASTPTSSSPITQTTASSSTRAVTTESTTITTAPAITIEPPIVPVTNNPGQETQKTKFNVTFTVLTLRFTSSLQNQTSPSYMDISSNILDELNQLYANSKVNSTFVKCHSVSFRPASDGNSTVEAFCDFIKNASAQQVDKVLLYHEFQNNTNGITTLGSYSLDSNSLFVDGYHESVVLTTTTPAVTTQTSTPEVKPIEFNVTFVIANLEFVQSLQDTNSSLYKSASSVISHQLTDLYSKSKINVTFSTCKTVSFSPANIGGSTSVYAVCTFRNDSTAPQVDRVTVYHEFRDNTNGTSTFGIYSLDNNSLYVNGYHESTPLPTISPILTTTPTLQAEPYDFNVTFIITNLAPTTSLLSPGSALFKSSVCTPIVVTTPNLQPNPLDFNVTFIITNLVPTASLQDSSSQLYKSAASILAYKLDNVFKNSNINKTFSNCKVLSFSAASADSTNVSSICTFGNNSSPQDVNRVTVYHEFRDNTKGISTLGAYSLDNNSLYVNGYHESAPTSSPIVVTTPNLQRNPFDFNVTFIITNLVPTASLLSSNSALYKSAASILAYKLDNVFKNSNINKTFSSCKVLSFRAANADSTSVSSICTFGNDSSPQDVNRVTVYHEFRDNTKDISTLGPYSLDNNSLYVNGYHESAPSSPPIVVTTPNLQTNPFDFNVTFIITNLAPTVTLQDSSSQLYKSAASILAYKLDNLFKKSNIKKTFSDCKVLSFRLANVEDTSVYAVCSFSNESNPQEVNKVTVYHEFRDNTKGISTLGSYLLNSDSLYVNGYHEPASNLQTKPFEFNVTFVITNLAPTASLLSSNSALYKSASSVIAYKLNNLFTNSKINRTFSSCRVLSFSRAKVGSTSVYSICTFGNDSSPQEVNRVTVYHEFKNKTKDISVLGTYSLDDNSLYVNGYHESPPSITEAPIVVVTLQPNEGTKPIDLNVTFTIDNLAFTPALQNPNSPQYTSASSNVISSLNNLYKNSKIKETFTNCKLVSFSSANQGKTKVETLCSFKNDPTVPGVDKVTAYNEFRDNTGKITALGEYSLNQNSLFVNGYQELESTPVIREGDLPFELNFTIINRNFTEALNDPTSAEYQSISANVTRMLETLYKNSSLKDSYRTCKVTGLRIGSVKVTCICYFNPSAASEGVTAEQVKKEFATGTNSTDLLGNTYQLRSNSLAVEAKAPVSNGRTEIPYWGIILIVLGILLILFLIFALCLLIALCLKKKYHGSYNMLQNAAGVYFPHQKYY
ncbi:mucin-16-like [Mustelus asterias]